MTEGNDLLTPVGRIVQGSLYNPRTTNMQGVPLVNKKDNSPRVQFYIGLAVEKTNPEEPAFWARLYGIGAALAPAVYTGATFAWKRVDGDAPEHVTKQGHAGHWIYKFENGFPPSIFTASGAARIVDPDAVMPGDYVRVSATAAFNNSSLNPGLFLNLRAVELLRKGDPIVFGPSGDVFNHQSAYMPAEALRPPPAPATTIAPPVGAPAYGNPVAPPAGAPPAPAYGNPVAPPAGTPQPDHTFVQGPK